MALNFADVAGKSMAEVERPPLPPVGTYRWKITKLPEQTESNNGQWDIVNFNVQAQEALDDVDTDDYKGDITGIFQRRTFMFNKEAEADFERTLFNMKNFLEKHCGVEEGLSIAEALNASVGCEFLGTIGWRQDKEDPEIFYAEIKRTAPIE